jgi:2-C-methyl-D-erythritol 4-phosphate cytidylyltransferase
MKRKQDTKNIALIIAGGVGNRMGQDIPKQFLNVYDKPVIVYTMESFQHHPDIHGIVIVCIDGWHEMVRSYAKQFSITKLDSVVPGGKTGFESIINGTKEVERLYGGDALILVHDAIRPNLSQEIITENIRVCHEKGNAITCVPCQEAMLYSKDRESSLKSINRDELLRTQTPQTFYVKDLRKVQEEALAKGMKNTTASCTLMVEMRHRVYKANGSEKNVKLTTPEDIEIFKALINSKKDEWMK